LNWENRCPNGRGFSDSAELIRTRVPSGNTAALSGMITPLQTTPSSSMMNRLLVRINHTQRRLNSLFKSTDLDSSETPFN
jgi:hypothetical protein